MNDTFASTLLVLPGISTTTELWKGTWEALAVCWKVAEVGDCHAAVTASTGAATTGTANQVPAVGPTTITTQSWFRSHSERHRSYSSFSHRRAFSKTLCHDSSAGTSLNGTPWLGNTVLIRTESQPPQRPSIPPPLARQSNADVLENQDLYEPRPYPGHSVYIWPPCVSVDPRRSICIFGNRRGNRREPIASIATRCLSWGSWRVSSQRLA